MVKSPLDLERMNAHNWHGTCHGGDMGPSQSGALRFPEYGAQRYRAETGSALVFSSSLLHEVLEVTSGRRYVLLSHLYGADGHAGRPAARPA